MRPDQPKNTAVTPGQDITAALISWVSWLSIVKVLPAPYSDAVPRDRPSSKRLGRYIRELRGDRPAPALADVAGIVSSRWYQVENDGDVPPAQTLWEMGRALGATASQLEEMFKLAAYEGLFDHLTRIGSSRTPSVPGTAELGISADPVLSPEAKAELLKYLQRIRATEEG